MNEPSQRFRAKVGDVVTVHGHHLGESGRLGEILEVLGEPDHVHFRVRWDDEHESIFYPGNDASVRVRRRKRKVNKP
ncbi:MAG TPA: DUF1918 domain-containing protein [Gaiellaceae bacterium]